LTFARLYPTDSTLDTMPKRSSVVVACAAAGVLLCSQHAFVPAPQANRKAQISAVAGSVAALGAAPAFADEIGDAATKLSKASYPFLKEIDWNSYIFNLKPGSASAIDWLKAIDKAIVMGNAMDAELLKRATIAHSVAIRSIDANGVPTLGDYTIINAALGRLVASVPEDTVMDVYNAFALPLPKEVPEYMMSKVNADDAKAAYAAFLEFKDVVKSHPIRAVDPGLSGVAPAKLAKIDAAAKVLSEKSYPFIKDIDWTSDLYQKPLPGAGPKEMLKAVDKALIMGAAMDPRLLKEAGEAHHKAILSIDKNGVTSAADYAAINSGIGKLIASVPKAQVLDVFNSFKDLAGPVVPGNLYTTVNNPGDAVAAYNAFWQFKDVVLANSGR